MTVILRRWCCGCGAPNRARAVRVEKRAGDSAKRQKMTEDLERRERAFRAERSEEQTARARLQVRGCHFKVSGPWACPRCLHGSRLDLSCPTISGWFPP